MMKTHFYQLLWGSLLLTATPFRGQAGATPDDAGNDRHTIATPGLTMEINDQGEIVTASIGERKIRRELHGLTALAGCAPRGQALVRRVKEGVEFERTLQQPDGGRMCKVIDHFTPGSNSIRWEVTILSEGPAWSTEIQTRLAYPASPALTFWTAWSQPGQVANGAWAEDPLTPVPLQAMRFDYGAPPVTYDAPQLGWCPSGNLFCMPLATLIEANDDIGVSLVLSPGDVMRELLLTTNAAGEVVMSRSRLRLGGNRPIVLDMDLVAHEGDWRGGLRWMAQHYPQYFDSPNPQAHAMAGTSAYSSAGTDFDAGRMKKMAFRVNWKASFDFPYIGMFLPPVKSGTEKWPRFGGRETTLDEMANYSTEMRRMGFHVLSYFNVAEFGARVTWPPPPPKDTKIEDLWKNCDDFLQAKLAAAILRVPDRMKPGALAASIYPKTKVGGYSFTWIHPARASSKCCIPARINGRRWNRSSGTRPCT